MPMSNLLRVLTACAGIVGVGVMGMLGNKGGASVRMTVFDSAMCFTCAHLAAHR